MVRLVRERQHLGNLATPFTLTTGELNETAYRRAHLPYTRDNMSYGLVLSFHLDTGFRDLCVDVTNGIGRCGDITSCFSSSDGTPCVQITTDCSC